MDLASKEERYTDAGILTLLYVCMFSVLCKPLNIFFFGFLGCSDVERQIEEASELEVSR